MEAVVIGIVLAGVLLFASMKTVKGDDRAIVERLGRPVSGVRGPGIVWVIPFIERLRIVDVGSQKLELRKLSVITVDNRSMSIDLVVAFRLFDPVKASSEVSDYRQALTELAGTAARGSANGKALTPNVFDRDALAELIRSKIEPVARSWGNGIDKVEVTAVG